MIPPLRAAKGGLSVRMTMGEKQKRGPPRLDGSNEGAVGGNVTVRHARSVEGETGCSIFVQHDQPPCAFTALRQKLHGGLCCARGSRTRWTKKVCCRFCHHDFHDSFAETRGGDTTSVRIGIAATTDQRRIADATGKLAARPPGGSGRNEIAVLIESDSADSALLMAAMVFGRVGVFSAVQPRLTLGGRDEFVGIAKGDTVIGSEVLGAFRNKHHVRALFKHNACRANGIFHAAQTGDRPCPQSGSVHDDRVALNVAIEVQVRTEAGVEDGIVFQDDDRGLDGIESRTAFGKHGPTGAQSALTTAMAGDDSVIGNIPGAAVNNERGLHGETISDISDQLSDNARF